MRLRRRLQRVGGGTFVVSLPKRWVERMNLNRGSEVIVEEGPGGSIIVYTDEPSQLETSVVFESEREDVSLNRILSKYLAGYDIIEIEFSEGLSLPIRRRVISFIKNLPGMEIEEENESSMTLRCISSPMDPRRLMRKMHGIAFTMLKDAISVARTGNQELAEMVKDRDDELDRSYFVAVRTARKALMDVRLMSKFGISPVKLMDFRMAAMFEEWIGDHAVDLTETRFNGDMGTLLRDLEVLQNLVLRSFMTGEEILVHKVKSLSEKIRGYLKEGEFFELIGRVVRTYTDIADLSSSSWEDGQDYQ